MYDPKSHRSISLLVGLVLLTWCGCGSPCHLIQHRFAIFRWSTIINNHMIKLCGRTEINVEIYVAHLSTAWNFYLPRMCSWTYLMLPMKPNNIFRQTNSLLKMLCIFLADRYLRPLKRELLKYFGIQHKQNERWQFSSPWNPCSPATTHFIDAPFSDFSISWSWLSMKRNAFGFISFSRAVQIFKYQYNENETLRWAWIFFPSSNYNSFELLLLRTPWKNRREKKECYSDNDNNNNNNDHLEATAADWPQRQRANRNT